MYTMHNPVVFMMQKTFLSCIMRQPKMTYHHGVVLEDIHSSPMDGFSI